MTETNKGLDPQFLRSLDEHIDRVRLKIIDGGRRQVNRSLEVLRETEDTIVRQEIWIRMVGQPASRLIRPMLYAKVWTHIPEEARQETSSQVAELVKKAESGDKVAQAILLQAQSILIEKNVDTKGLPSLGWKDPSTNPK